MRRFDRLVVSWERANHIWERHHLEVEQAREAFEDAGRRNQIYRGPRSRNGGRTYVARGRTEAGLTLWMLVKPSGQRRVARLISAREDR